MTLSPPSSSASSTVRARRRARRLGWISAAFLVAVVGAALVSISPVAADALGLTARPAGSPAPAVAPARWQWPVPPPISVVSPFRAPATPYGSGHRGIDVAASPGAPVVAPAAGTVRFAGQVAGRGVVAIDHGGGVVSAIEPVDAIVAAGSPVAAGDPTGVVSSGGHCDASCVHFGVRVDGEYVSPFLFLGGLPRAVLLPMG